LHQACTKESRFCTKRAPNFGLFLHQNVNRQAVAGLAGLHNLQKKESFYCDVIFPPHYLHLRGRCSRNRKHVWNIHLS
jgi:hypothetical protein